MKIVDYLFRLLIVTFCLLSLTLSTPLASTFFVAILFLYFVFLFLKEKDRKWRYLNLVLGFFFLFLVLLFT
ncbi:hypothetical protein CHH74_10395 [Shouchella clausii]|nr:hypothetical protein CHH74_10395 [Shouchella clausii]